VSGVNPSGWRPEAPQAGDAAVTTTTGNRALMPEEPLLFEIGKRGQTGVDIDTVELNAPRLGGPERGP